ncbi:two-component sensor histidine kinase [Rhizocola hellebori]|uniref:histidine kinase n=1 Tax=Rhizocola hellebori TaxID=1392758 RepID=A0A8J3VCY8_9ACTN|nr:histidine kinase [Rhizocola hellebori]GIH02036.1 two-component sensor histidine kinase [Rhizocola hellebori]
MTSASPSRLPQRHGRGGGGLALLTILVQTIGTMLAARGQEAQLNLLGYALLIGGGMLVSARHSSPRLTALAVGGVTVAYHVLDYPRGPTFMAAIVTAVALIRAGRHKLLGLTAIACMIAWIVLAEATFAQGLTLAAWVFGLAVVLEVVLGVGRLAAGAMREQRRAQQEKQRRQASEERLRIAQELHDVLGHHLSLINVRAGVGRHLMDRQPEQARAALDTIKDASAEALREVQSVLNALYPTGQNAPRAPQPGLDRLDQLTVDAGLPVHTIVTGQPRALPAEIDRAGYRIVQEALTNVRRHAGLGATATITLDYTPPEAMLVQVRDDGGGQGPIIEPAAEGNGISGMRERATTLGGSLIAEPMPGGGWQVSAMLPTTAVESS